MAEPADYLAERIAARTALIGIIGLGYVGLPLAAATARGGFRVIGFDIDPDKPVLLNRGVSYIPAVSADELKRHVDGGRFEATSDFTRLGECDVIIICVPTPLGHHREPDLSFIEATTRSIASSLRAGQIIVLESTTYPGTTREVVKPILEASGLASGSDFFLGFSPEREDPGNARFGTTTIPKVVSGDGPVAATLIEQFYAAVVQRTVPVSTVDTAEAVKITENVFRAVNIALVNELKTIFDAMSIDVWEVIEAAKTKPFGYMPFYPGPGLGGHCIPIDPFYLTWRSREFGLPTRFIELAGEINIAMPAYVIGKLETALGKHSGTALSKARILLIGLAYKKNVSDIRESPSLRLMQLLEERGARVAYHDPHVAAIPRTREYAAFMGRRSATLDRETLGAHDAVLVSTDHDAVDYALIAKHARLIVDTRNVFERNGIRSAHIVKA